MSNKARVATVWLDGCSGCHMSLLDMDEKIITLASLIEMVYSPTVDMKEFPENVDVCLVEGAASSDEDIHKLQIIRRNTKCLVALGDCAVNGNVPSMRNPFKTEDILNRAYVENATIQQQHPHVGVPSLQAKCRPIHEIVKVDVFVPGCPPPADAIYNCVADLLAGKTPDTSAYTRFGK
jgi:NAD-reducing hydrogenase small subunit